MWFEAVLWVAAGFCLVVALLFFGLLANAIVKIRERKK